MKYNIKLFKNTNKPPSSSYQSVEKYVSDFYNAF